MPARAPSLRTTVRRALASEAALPRGSTLLLAVSGGTDSMAMLDVVASLAPRFDIRVAAHGVDHGLRSSAAAELDAAAALAARLSVPFTRSVLALRGRANLQERARIARWRALASAAREANAVAVATAHHADDRAETVLLRLLRGAGARGLGAMPPRAPVPVTVARPAASSPIEVVRPMLRARKSAILQHLTRRDLPHALDPSNEDRRFLRARVRHELLPLLEELSPGIVAHLCTLADELDADARRTSSGDVRVRDWRAALPRGTQASLEALAASGSKSGRVWLPGGFTALFDGRARAPRSKPRP